MNKNKGTNTRAWWRDDQRPTSIVRLKLKNPCQTTTRSAQVTQEQRAVVEADGPPAGNGAARTIRTTAVRSAALQRPLRCPTCALALATPLALALAFALALAASSLGNTREPDAINLDHDAAPAQAHPAV